MKKSVVIALLAGILLLAGNLYVFRKLYTRQINYQKNILFNQAGQCAHTIQSNLQHFESDLNYILFSDDISELFSETSGNSQSLRKLEQFYSTYQNLITNIDIYDNHKNVFNLFKDKSFISDQYLAQRQRKLVAKEEVKANKNEYLYYIPVFKDNEVFGNIVVAVNLTDYLFDELNKFYVEGINYQWIIDPSTGEYTGNFPGDSIQIENYDGILANLKNDRENLILHRISNDSLEARMITAYKPFSVLDHPFGLAFSFNNTYFVEQIFTQTILIAAFSFLLFAITVYLLIFQVQGAFKKKKVAEAERDQLRNLLLDLPIGLTIFTKEGKIHYINRLAREMFLVKEDEIETGNTITEKFLKAGHRNVPKSAAFDSNQFILYEREGNEVILYRKEAVYTRGHEEFILGAFVDITAIEKSRKYEAASNTSKSEFLAKMSHEIRTPMNGIIGMTDALKLDNLTTEQKEYIDIVKRSADLLLSIIDDILDYSKIEAGKMQLEELPFKLSEEVKLSLDLFRAIIAEKGLQLTVSFAENVPDDIIGDPFRLRQVLSNLISNAVKFTHYGEIQVNVKVDEVYNGNVSLLFEVADTGVGIPEDRIDTIFKSFTQADYSTSRKYGGSGLGTTISKQLVNLMNGEIWCESPSGLSRDAKRPGSRFSFTIEVFSNEALQKELDYSGLKSFADIRALVLTPDTASSQRVRSFLQHLGIPCETFTIATKQEEKSQQLIQQLEASACHLLFLIDGPKLDGLWLARQLFQAGITDRSRVIMTSSRHHQDNYIQSKIARVDYYLIHPFEHHILRNYILPWFPGIPLKDMDVSVGIQKNLSVLVAEDNLINQKVAETIFSNLGYTIEIANDGSEAVDMVKKKAYDVVFMDLQMPGKDGVDATVDIRGMGYQMPIVAMTATASKVGRESALNSGMNDYITKPVKVEDVRSVLQKWFT